ncbi:similar to Saccharomyces cerevisiae YDR511W ACN9 Protein of the mitochondrial intermembrane space, required for acetate utilization and gluconeogenesis [Maudiozyma saulgeensis]|uniref:Succinate dehydrogenase assembly factor 3 n=1 Tax=Maudiozyma saulgeensis TaxID=1789683 RepID=A0A1X7R3U1_9SACH|nr:similar to Saccharomyces cerevisiae YDR511W ACN9 Protein of the mitochondrial intermembrane space, required for acetate utilization and gluconeogenesis [Kazachstania saulgeensis]
MNFQVLYKQNWGLARTYARRAASHSAQTKETLLPPLMLYRRILRAHRVLPEVQRSIGDKYVKNEFKLHKDVDNPLHIVGFLTSWQDYLHMISNGKWQEGTLSKSALEKMSPEQVGQLYELMKETERVLSGKPEDGKDKN